MSSTTRPPGPPGNWLLGNLTELRRDMLALFTRAAREYGDLVRLRIGPRSLYLVNHPDLIEEVLVHQARNYRKHYAVRMNRLPAGQRPALQ